MFGLDDYLSHLAQGHSVVVVVGVAFLLGLRHASDPDHLVAVSTLVAGVRVRSTRAAARLGATWGLGHATTVLAFGLPAIVLRAFIPDVVERAAEALIGAVIAVLAVRLLLKWRNGAFHVHLHDHDGERHLHHHSHAEGDAHAHSHRVRTPAQAYAIGLVHGLAGSAAITVLIVASVSDRRLAMLALVLLALGTAASMTALSAVVGRALSGARHRRLLASAVPGLAGAALCFGVWYFAAAVG